ncbi:MAG TPA: rhodanese-like domain-containing protein [Bacteroidales bacterium]|nr:rhodanese-like domain-containing protein [Bacteroidales bacterium]
MKSFASIVAFFLVICSSIAGQIPDSVKFKSLQPYYFHLTYLKEDPALIIDVREFFEYRGSRLRDAVNIPAFSNLEFSADTINKECALFLYCTTDYRSIRAARYFYDKGFRKLYSLKGGIVA